MHRSTRICALSVVAAFALSACGASNDPLASTDNNTSGTGQIVVGSANFPENQLLAEIYAGALSKAGLNVTTRLNIGGREVYMGALKDGSVSVIPEYTGNLAKYLNKDAEISTPKEAIDSLKKSLPEGLAALEPSQAENKDAVVVTKETANIHHLTSIEDLAPLAGDMILGGPPEWAQRPDGLQGLTKQYGLNFKEFKPLDSAGALTVTALKNGQVDAANLFTTDPQITANNFVVLKDPKNLFGSQQITPLVSADIAKNEKATQGLNKVSAALSTEDLTKEVAKVVIDKRNASDVAKEWLTAHGF
ncbi:ABC transporter substrate-binding protein [Dermatophilus congolensis]|uniref:ABC transporter substrate-binding protein n=1 Tax=Dermatophilus congolensis TaxID=1863 RepID=UPI001AAE9B4B|nr:ABC transporter substrate-binding protein [Dermatophilus congolensis]MBO3143854.1 ABC transporter substrate-binding protein [Dermatophilus congolensis]MBO3152845.1 ABC transporter substrate-binding protein [Dermatophilus congolensis]MBO3160145.1 ABC transporter substrate-binding protein [Dermatophilus congolensis]MBO3164130.1 ABC transporter substrate-binding protein [Dermatophilus congolensis]MBO3177676.1 ABC transporter substrate-binding protein [Dermatophilus congolensis]